MWIFLVIPVDDGLTVSESAQMSTKACAFLGHLLCGGWGGGGESQLIPEAVVAARTAGV